MVIVSLIFVIVLLFVVGLGQYKENGKRVYNNRFLIIVSSALALVEGAIIFNTYGRAFLETIETVAIKSTTVAANAVFAEVMLFIAGVILVVGALVAFFFAIAYTVGSLGRR